LGIKLIGLKVAVIGGDRRELELIKALAETECHLVAVGFNEALANGVADKSDDLIDAVKEADCIIAPMSNTDDKGFIKAVMDPSLSLQLTEDVFGAMKKGAVLFIGMAKPVIGNLAQKYGIKIIQTAEVDEIAILNSIPTAEGAIQRAMEELPITIHGCQAGVIGFGRCGITLARVLYGLGAETTVIARNPAQLARATEMGLKTARWHQIIRVLSTLDVVFNTVPAMVLTKEVLTALPKDCLVIDIASSPGGTDFAAAKELGIKAFLELGLPGRVAPKSAGRILANTMPYLIAEETGLTVMTGPTH
jgi:dipicolinate synthase subunit A